MKIEFIQTFSGTRDFFQKGTVEEIKDSSFAKDLISNGYAKAIVTRKKATKKVVKETR